MKLITILGARPQFVKASAISREIKKHSDSLVKFIQTTSTPITIGVQGEWGSGKTSLLNSIKGDQNKVEELCKIYLDPNYTYDL